MNYFESEFIKTNGELILPDEFDARGKQIIVYLEQIKKELPTVMLAAGGEDFSKLYKAARDIGRIAQEEFEISQWE